MLYTLTINDDGLIEVVKTNIQLIIPVGNNYFYKEDGSKYKFNTSHEAVDWVNKNIQSYLINYDNYYIKKYNKLDNINETRKKYLK